MKAQNILVPLAGLLATGVQASPCKPSSSITSTSGEINATTATKTTAASTTTTDETTTELETSSVELTSSTETTTAAETTTASETITTATTTASPGLTYQCPGGFPSGPKCGVKEEQTGSGATYLGIQIGSFTIDECVQFCIDTPNCDYFAKQDLENDGFCEFWSGTFASQGYEQPWAWYEMDCFCNLPVENLATTTAITPP